MKPLLTITILSRDTLGVGTKHVKTIEVDTLGTLEIVLSRDAMGEIQSDTEPTIKPNVQFLEIIDEATKTLGELHVKMGEMQIANQHALTDMFAMHKVLTG